VNIQFVSGHQASFRVLEILFNIYEAGWTYDNFNRMKSFGPRWRRWWRQWRRQQRQLQRQKGPGSETGQSDEERDKSMNEESDKSKNDKRSMSENEGSSNKTSGNSQTRKRKSRPQFKEYTKVYSYQSEHFMKQRKTIGRQANKCKTKEGKSHEGPLKDDDTYVSSSSSVDQVGSDGRYQEPPTAAKKRPRISQLAGKRGKKKKVKTRKAGKQARKRGESNQVLWAGKMCRRIGDGFRVPWTVVQANGRDRWRVWDGERTEREGGGKAATVTRFRLCQF
jgi:hypothetical protein